ncbi:hypothetical protein [Nocardioides sp. MH1]|uniref:hypothetical protein n=1 Tax=Nocardioides sp. MH1 TaxID=3242490 RepID=UPI003520CCA8
MDRPPCRWLASGTWPDGEFQQDSPDAVAYAVEIARALEAALEGKNKSAVASHARIERTVLYRILQGTSWPDTLSIAKLELALDTSLWPANAPVLRRRREDPGATA